MNGQQTKRKTGIRYKVIRIICLSTLIVISSGVVIWYFFNIRVFGDMVGDVHRKLSQLLANGLTVRIDDEIARIKGYANIPLLNEVVTKGDLQNNYPGPSAGNTLKEIVDKDANIAGMSLINGSGIAVASSKNMGKPDQAYIKICRTFFSGPRKTAFIGDVEFDEGLNAWVIPVYLSIKDRDGRLSGLLEARLSVKHIFSPLSSFRIDNTGRAVVVDSKGSIMFHPGTEPTNVKICNDDDYQKLLTSRNKYAIIYEPNVYKKHIFVAFSEVGSTALVDSGKVWRVMIEEDIKEVFAPINRMIPQLIIVIILLLVIMVVAGFIFSGVLVRPIEELYTAAVRIRDGNWDYKINVKTGDEIEQFADAFKAMISNIRDKQEELLKAKKELEVLSRSLEEKVRTRTIDLTMAKNKIDTYAKELEKALMVKSDFIAMASHELRTPLTAIKEGVSIILEGKAGAVSSQQEEFLEIAKRNLNRLGRIINDILDLQKLEDGKMVITVQDNDINEAVQESYRIMMPVAQEKGLKFVTELGDNIPIIKFDKDKIIQVLINLISNAIRYTEKGLVSVGTSTSNNIIKISIKDTGVGIRKEDMPQLFQKFTQIEKGFQRKPGGTGLGLTISRQIIEKHGGKVWAESVFGEGSTFYFVLPIEERRRY